jgi:hypothetical protein
MTRYKHDTWLLWSICQVKEASYRQFRSLGVSLANSISARYVPKYMSRRILSLASFWANPNSIFISPYHFRSFQVPVGMVWSQETGARAGSVRYPPSWETPKMTCLFVLFFPKILKYVHHTYRTLPIFQMPLVHSFNKYDVVRCVLGWTAEGNAVVGWVAKRVQCIPYTISGGRGLRSGRRIRLISARRGR